MSQKVAAVIAGTLCVLALVTCMAIFGIGITVAVFVSLVLVAIWVFGILLVWAYSFH